MSVDMEKVTEILIASGLKPVTPTYVSDEEIAARRNQRMGKRLMKVADRIEERERAKAAKQKAIREESAKKAAKKRKLKRLVSDAKETHELIKKMKKQHYSKARLRGIIKGIEVDRIINKSEAPTRYAASSRIRKIEWGNDNPPAYIATQAELDARRVKRKNRASNPLIDVRERITDKRVRENMNKPATRTWGMH